MSIPVARPDYYARVSFGSLLGKTLAAIELAHIADHPRDRALLFRVSDSEAYLMWHEQDCCESCDIEGFSGDMSDVLGSPLVMAEEVTEKDMSDVDESQTWTFYKLATAKGYVTIAWRGESNGYYSETVDFARVEAPSR